ncbi:MAG: nucleotidyltransferase domain-containing protein [Chitinophagaceae bacterium]
MITEIKDNMEASRQVCKDLSVSKLYLFGSAARETGYNDASNIDFLFRFDDKVENMEMGKKPIIWNYCFSWKIFYNERWTWYG